MSRYQNYPRSDDFLDETLLVPHAIKLSPDQLRTLIIAAIRAANVKSSQVILSIPPDATEAQRNKIYEREGKKLFRYFKDYSPDPPATAHQIKGKTYLEVGQDLFVRRTLQKERMNAGWRYQYLTIYCARETKRFESISDLGLAEADFSAKIERIDKPGEYVNLYVSVKNRKNTIGGQDFPKAVQALENIASTDKNRIGPYCCIFGITIDRGTRQIRSNKQGKAHSQNTEVWLSDFFWPFFTNFTAEEIHTAVDDVLESHSENGRLTIGMQPPHEVLHVFGALCRTIGLIDTSGVFSDSYKLVRFFCDL